MNVDEANSASANAKAVPAARPGRGKAVKLVDRAVLKRVENVRRSL